MFQLNPRILEYSSSPLKTLSFIKLRSCRHYYYLVIYDLSQCKLDTISSLNPRSHTETCVELDLYNLCHIDLIVSLLLK